MKRPTRITVTLTAPAARALDALHATGLYGHRRAQVAERLMMRGLEQALTALPVQPPRVRR